MEHTDSLPPGPLSPERARPLGSVRGILLALGVIISAAAIFLLLTTEKRLDAEMGITAPAPGEEVFEMPPEVQELMDAERSRELRRRRVVFGGFLGVGVCTLLGGLLLRRRAAAVITTAFTLHIAATALYYYISRPTGNEDALAPFGGKEMTVEKMTIIAVIALGFLGLTIAAIAARPSSRRTVQ